MKGAMTFEKRAYVVVFEALGYLGDRGKYNVAYLGGEGPTIATGRLGKVGNGDAASGASGGRRRSGG